MVIDTKILSEGYVMTEFGAIPKDWKLESLGNMCSGPLSYGLNESAIEFNEYLPRYLRITDITTEGKLHESGAKSVIVKNDDYLLCDGDIVVARTGATVGKSYLYNEKDGSCAYAGYLIRIRVNEKILSPHFLIQVMHSHMYYKWIKNTLKEGAQPNINSKEYASFKLAVPSLLEQQKIAEILSAADEQIEITEQLIQKTKDLKKGLMQRLLTKGLRDTQFKSSDLGEIPIEWDVVQFNNICTRIIVGIASSTSKYYTTEKAVPILRNQNIKENKIGAKEILYITREFDEMNYKKRLRKDDLLTVRTGYPGLTAVVPSEFEEAQSFTTLISSPNPVLANSHYLAYYMNSEIGKKDLTGLSAGGAQQNLNVRSLSTFKLKLPPLAEQVQIVNILSSVDKQIEIYEKERRKQIELKKALMQKLLTGKLRVTV